MQNIEIIYHRREENDCRILYLVILLCLGKFNDCTEVNNTYFSNSKYWLWIFIHLHNIILL